MKHYIALCMTLILSGAVPVHANEVIIDASKTAQTIEGFGTCLVTWGKSRHRYDEELADIYTEGFGFNILRVPMGAWHIPKAAKPTDITVEQIVFDGKKKNERVNISLGFAKKLKQRNKDIKIIGSVWSPPAWMKFNNHVTNKGQSSIQGNSYNSKKKKGVTVTGRLKPELYDHFAHWMVVQMQQYKQEGVPFHAISIGNEVMFSQDFESCVWTAKDYATMVGLVGEAKAKHGFKDVMIFGPETMTKHNWSIANPLYIKELKANATAWKHFDRFATHGYVDGFKEDMGAEGSTEFWNLIKDKGKPAWVTEGGTGDHDWPAPLTGIAKGIHNALVHGKASAFVPWQVSGGKKNSHCVMVEKTYTKKSHAFRHFSKFIDEGAVRLDLGDVPGMLSAYFDAKRKRLTLVAVNPETSPQTYEASFKGLKVSDFDLYRTTENEDLAKAGKVSVKGGQATLSMPAQSIVTWIGAL